MVPHWFLIAGIAAVALVVLWLATVAETLLTTLTEDRAESFVEEGVRGAVLLLGQLEQPERTLHPVLLLRVAAELAFGGSVLYAVADTSPFVALVLLLPLAVIMHLLGVAWPRAWVLRDARHATAIAPYVVAATQHVWPLRYVADANRRFAGRLGRGQPERRASPVLDLGVLADAFNEGTQTADPSDPDHNTGPRLISSIVDFSQTVVREIMVPRTAMGTVNGTMTIGEAVRVVQEQQWSRYPVVGEGIDNIVGVVHARDIMGSALAGRGKRAVMEAMTPATFVPEAKRAAALLRDMQRDQIHLVIVVDEYGGTAGLVTLEDVLEELVGEIADETDDDPPAVETLADGRLRVNAGLLIQEANEYLGGKLPEGDWDTVGGLVVHLCGRAPTIGEEVRVDGTVLTVEAISGRRILTLLVESTS